MIHSTQDDQQTLESVSGRSSIKYEASPRWIRVKFGGDYIADTRNALLVWDNGFLPVYYFPIEDVRQEMLVTGHRSGKHRQLFDVHSGDRRVKAAAWSYPDPSPERSYLEGYVAFEWEKMDGWFEEEEQVIAHPRDPYHRVDALLSSRHVKIEIDGLTLAESIRPVLLFETNLPARFYLPQEDIRMDLLEPSQETSLCPYKGLASYWSVRTDTGFYSDIVWGYKEPLPEVQKIAGLLSFYNEKVDTTVDGRLLARPNTIWS